MKLAARQLALLCAVRAGAEGVWAVAALLGVRPRYVLDDAAALVQAGLLCALDGEPWAVTVAGWQETEGLRP